MSNHYTELTSRGVLCISGPDSQAFLQGQTTCDLDRLDAETALAGAYCTPQGRMVCDFRILGCGSNAWLMQMHAGICDEAAATFGKYIVFSKAEIENVTGDWRQFALWGPDAAKLIGATERKENQVCSATGSDSGARWIQTDPDGHCFEACVPAAEADALEQLLSGKLDKAGEQDYHLVEIEAGVGHVAPETVGMFLPQMLNYQLTDRLSFNKGCYTGQEVVARMHYRGKLKRPMYLASAEAELPAPGSPLFRSGSEQSVGNVVNAVGAGDTVRLLAVVITRAIAGGVHLGSSTGPPLSFLDLPYSLEDQASG